MNKIKLLGLSGSLRKNSYNTAVLNALKIVAPSHVEIQIGEIRDLPLFNPDREDEDIPSLSKLKLSLSEASGLVIASPEYAHGISGPLKNALDWLVGGVEFPYKPIMLINTSPRATHAQEALKEVLLTMSGIVVEKSFLALDLLGSDLDSGGIVENTKMVSALRKSLSSLCEEIE